MMTVAALPVVPARFLTHRVFHTHLATLISRELLLQTVRAAQHHLTSNLISIFQLEQHALKHVHNCTSDHGDDCPFLTVMVKAYVISPLLAPAHCMSSHLFTTPLPDDETSCQGR